MKLVIIIYYKKHTIILLKAFWLLGSLACWSQSWGNKRFKKKLFNSMFYLKQAKYSASLVLSIKSDQAAKWSCLVNYYDFLVSYCGFFYSLFSSSGCRWVYLGIDEILKDSTVKSLAAGEPKLGANRGWKLQIWCLFSVGSVLWVTISVILFTVNIKISLNVYPKTVNC